MNRPSARVRDLLIEPRTGRRFIAMAVLGGPACSAAAMISQAAEETVGGIMANALGHTKFLDSRGMREMLSGSDFSALDLNNGNTTVYFVLPPEYLTVHQRALRLVVNTFLTAAAKGRKGKHPTLYILDEFLQPWGALDHDQGRRDHARLRRAHVVDRPEPDAADRAVQSRMRRRSSPMRRRCRSSASTTRPARTTSRSASGNRVRWRKREMQTNQGMRVEWEPAGACSLRDGTEVGRSTSREGGLQIVLNEGGDPFLLRRTSYDKLFKPGEYAPDPFEPRRQSLANRWFEKLRKVVS